MNTRFERCENYTKTETNMTPVEKEMNLVLLVNSYYNIQEAADMMLRQAQAILNSQDKDLKHKQLQRHKRLMGRIEVMKREIESLEEDYGEAFANKFVTKTDEVRRAGAYIARIILNIGDRCGNDDTGAKEQLIEEYIKAMPEQGYLHQEIESKFYMK